MVNKEEVAEFLVQKGYLLTALEFYQELLEDDGTDLDLLKDYFIKQQPNFEVESPRLAPAFRGERRRANSVSDHDYNFHDSDSQIKERDDKIALLEYELRRAREDISTLRNQLTNIVKKSQAPTATATTSATISSDNESQLRLQREAIKPHEMKILNFLIKNYLVDNHMSLTAITFTEEMADDMDDWKDVGLDTPEPPKLLSLYRFFFDNEDSGIQGAFTKSMNELSKLKKDLSDKDEDHRSTKKKLQQYQKDNEKLQSNIKDLEATVEELKKGIVAAAPTPIAGPTSATQDASAPADRTTPKAQQPVEDTANTAMRAVFKRLVRKRRANAASFSKAVTETDSAEAENSARIAHEVERIPTLEADNQGTVKLVADCLPHIVPGVILNKREELIPVILCVISQHPDNTTRFALTKLLFNLIKKPNESQRQVIMNGCIALASMIGPQRTESELLTQVWEQIAEKHAERRVLVADSCGAIAPYSSPELRQSLLLSILQQMSEDRTALVRQAVAKNLAVLIAYFDNGEKYAQVEQLFLKLLLQETDEEVVNVVRTQLLFALADWTDLHDCFHTKFLSMLLSEIQSLVIKNEGGGDAKLINKEVQHMHLLLGSLIALAPRIKEYVFSFNPSISVKDASTLEVQSVASYVSSKNQPTPTNPNNNSLAAKSLGASQLVSPLSLSILGEKSTARLKQVFDAYMNSQPEGSVTIKEDWSSLDWLVKELLPRLMKIIVATPASDALLVQDLVELVHALCTEFGVPFTKKVVKYAFFGEMYKDSIGKAQNQAIKLRILPVYLSGVLTSLDDAELIKFLHEIIVNVSVEEGGWDHSHLPVLKEVIGQLCSGHSFSTNKKLLLLDTLSDMLGHPANQVRACVVALFNVAIPSAKPEEIFKKILPSLIVLGNDPDRTVRFACIEPFGNICVSAPDDPEQFAKIADAFDKILEDQAQGTRLEVVRTLSNIIPYLVMKPRFRDTYILPLLVDQARRNNLNKNTDGRREMAQSLFDGFRTLAGVNLRKESIEEQVIPGLKALLNDTQLMDPTFRPMVQSMLHDMEVRLTGEADKEEVTGSASVGKKSGSGILGKLGDNTPLASLTNIGVNINKIADPKSWTWKKP